MNRRSPEALREEVTPYMTRLVELHHPTWDADQVGPVAEKLVDATEILTRKLSYIPRRNPARAVSETRRAKRQYYRNLNLIKSINP